jgi:hypothetical protein
MEQKFRIRKLDKLNWIVEEFEPAGVVSRGAHVGKEKAAKWILVGYYPTLVNAAGRVLDKEIAAGWTGEDIREVVTEARNRVEWLVEEAIRTRVADLEAQLAEQE